MDITSGDGTSIFNDVCFYHNVSFGRLSFPFPAVVGKICEKIAPDFLRGLEGGTRILTSEPMLAKRNPVPDAEQRWAEKAM